MSKTLDRDLISATRNIRRMILLVEESIESGVSALRDRNQNAADSVLDGDDAIDDLENEVSEQCHRILALHQPMARNLRQVVAILHVSTELERMGDLARSIAERARHLVDSPAFPVPPRLGEMTGRVLSMVHSGLDAFLTEDTLLAREVRDRDSEVDDDHSTIIRDLIEEMKRTPQLVEPALSIFSAVRHLERIADHATNVAEETVFLVEGQTLRHRHAVESPRSVGSARCRTVTSV